jgi:uncharacterized membrane protein (DUF4010 family)
VTSALGGLVDVGTVILSSSDLVRHSAITLDFATEAVMMALAGNMVLKTAIAAVAGSKAFAWRLAVALWLMYGTGFAIWLMWR